jgi:hypothetical protein
MVMLQPWPGERTRHNSHAALERRGSPPAGAAIVVRAPTGYETTKNQHTKLDIVHVLEMAI